MSRLREKIRTLSLRHKAWLVTLIILLLLVITIGGGVDYFIIRSFSRLEKRSIEKNALSVRYILLAEIDTLKRTTRDYALWTDTYEFMSTADPVYYRSNFSEEVLKNLQLSGVFLYHPDGIRALGLITDQEGRFSAAGKNWDLYFTGIFRSADKSGDHSSAGIKMFGGSIYVFSCYHILRDDGSGKPAGYLVHLRRIDDAVTGRLSGILRLNVSVSDISAGDAAGFMKTQKTDDYFVTDITGNSLVIHVVMRDSDGDPAAVFRIPSAREINREAKRGLLLFHIVLLVLLFAAGFLIERFLLMSVISRLESITGGLNGVAESMDLSSRLPARDGDELDRLAKEINSMLDSLELVEKERWIMQENLLHAKKLEAVGTMAGGVAHDFNNMLASILGSAELIKIDLKNGRPVEKHIDRIEEAGQKAVGLVKQLLALNRGQSAERIALNLGKEVHDTVRFISTNLPDNVEIKLIQTAENDRVNIDQTQLQRVLINMINNSVHAMAGKVQGRINIGIEDIVLPCDDARPETRALPPGRYMQLTVSDTGEGIPQDVVDRIFEPFFSTKPSGSGTGLGLTIAHNFAENHGGSIGVKSSPGEGTTFFIHLPAEQTPGMNMLSHTGKGYSVLLVDDDTLVRDTLAEGLKRMGYTLYTASSGFSALAVIDEKKAELTLVITDQIMPGMTGHELRKKIEEIKPGLPVMLLSGYMGAPDESSAGIRGFAKIVMKPITIEQLDLAIREIISASGTQK